MRIIYLLIALMLSTASFSQDYTLDQKLGENYIKVVEQEMGFYQNDSLLNMVNRIGNRLTAQLYDTTLKFRFFLVDSREPNAFAVPGGFIFVTRGLFPILQTEDELAGIIAHEITHVVKRHSVKQMKSNMLPALLKIPGGLLNAVTGTNLGNILNSPIDMVSGSFIASYSREHEFEADWYGALMSSKAGYKTDALADALARLTKTVEVFTGQEEDPSWLDDHPATDKRVQKIHKLAEKNPPVKTQQYTLNHNGYVNLLDGLLLGQNPQQGMFIDSLFIHPELDFSLIVPSKWHRDNKPSSMTAMDEKGEAALALQMVDNSKSVQTYANELMEKLKENTTIKVLANSDTTINQKMAHIVRLESTDPKQPVIIEIIWIKHKGNLYQLVGLAIPQQYALTHTALCSFTNASASDINNIELFELKSVTAQPNETLTDLSKRTNNRYKTPIIAVINDITETQAIPEQQTIKIVSGKPYKAQ